MQFEVSGRAVFAATGGRPFDPARPAMVFVHGAGMDHTVWSMQARYFAHHGFSVLAFDLPGHGRSDGPPPDGIEDCADWLLQALAVAGAEAPRLIGHSMGALIALAAAARLGAEAGGLALLGAVPRMAVHPDLLKAAGDGDHAAVETMVGWGVGRRAQMGGFRAPGAWVAGASLRLLEKADPAVLAADLPACDRWGGAMEAAAAVTCPALVLFGSDDRMTPPRQGAALADAIPGAQKVTLAEAGHMMMIEQPDETLDALAAFFAVPS